MDNFLHDLKDNMDQTVLRSLDLSEKSKAKIRKRIKGKPSSPVKWKPDFSLLLSVCIFSAFFLGIGYYTVEKLGILPGGNPTTLGHQKLEQPSRNVEIPAAIESRESYKNMSKEDIVGLLFNSVDHFKTAEGKFQWKQTYADRSSTYTYTSEYKISLENPVGGYDKESGVSEKPANTLENGIFFNENTVWVKQGSTKRFSSSPYEKEQKKNPLRAEDIFTMKLEENMDNNFREHPPVGLSGNSLFPSYFAFPFLHNKDMWEIEKQNEELLGHNTIVVSGKVSNEELNKFIRNAKDATESFRYWIDKDSGILVKYETYDGKGNITGYLHPEKLAVNVPVKEEEFIPELDGYTSYEDAHVQKRDPREKDIEVVEAADTFKEETDKVVKKLRKELPFFYEFEHPDLTLFSANMEKYKNYKHGYLTYSYKKERDEQGSGRNLIYIRMYHKDSFVRNTGDFEIDKSKHLKELSMNGIHWDVYGVRGTATGYFYGTKGDYVYELVGQGLSLEKELPLLNAFLPEN